MLLTEKTEVVKDKITTTESNPLKQKTKKAIHFKWGTH